MSQPTRGLGSTCEAIFSFPQMPQVSSTPSSKYEDDSSLQLPSSTPYENDIFLRSTKKEPASRFAQVTQKWSISVPIGAQAFQPEVRHKSDPKLMGFASPEMANSNSLHTPLSVSKPRSPLSESIPQPVNDSVHPGSSNVSPSDSSNSTESQAKSSSASMNDPFLTSSSSLAYTMIPNTRNRAPAMDITQAPHDHNANVTDRNTQINPAAESVFETASETRVSSSMERRRFSYDRSSAISVIPPLEATCNGTSVETNTWTLDTLQYKTPKPGICTDGIGRTKIHLGQS